MVFLQVTRTHNLYTWTSSMWIYVHKHDLPWCIEIHSSINSGTTPINSLLLLMTFHYPRRSMTWHIWIELWNIKIALKQHFETLSIWCFDLFVVFLKLDITLHYVNIKQCVFDLTIISWICTAQNIIRSPRMGKCEMASMERLNMIDPDRFNQMGFDRKRAYCIVVLYQAPWSNGLKITWQITLILFSVSFHKEFLDIRFDARTPKHWVVFITFKW